MNDYEKTISELIERHTEVEIKMNIQAVNMLNLKDENKRLRDAMTPSGDTKATHIGEYSFSFPMAGQDEDGEHVEWDQNINVPWTTVKEIMKAIEKDALEPNSNK